MAESILLRASLDSLKRVDPYVKDILATATQVALYKFINGENIWEKAEKEGALFLYSRNGEPLHSLMILNRLNADNFIEPILTRDFDCQVQLPFLLYRSKSKIFGIWFFNRDECIKVASLIETLIMEKDKMDDKSLQGDKPPNGQTNIDIFSMLSKAQEDFNRTPSKPDNPSFSASTPRAPEIASESVKDFFAKATTKGPGEHVLQRIMSNPVHSVGHIEKQQRSVTPQELGYRGEGDRRSVPLAGMLRLDGVELPPNGINFQNVSPPKQMSSSPLSFLVKPHQQNMEDSELGTSPFQQFLENSSKPLLMTPRMFAQSVNSDSGATSYRQKNDEGAEVAMLTDKQLAQALIYLLNHDSNFIKQIHQAYVNSILEKVNMK